MANEWIESSNNSDIEKSASDVIDELSISSEERTGVVMENEEFDQARNPMGMNDGTRWNDVDIWKQLQKLSDYDNINNSLQNDHLDELLETNVAQAILITAYRNYPKQLKLLVDSATILPTQIWDGNGYTAVHLAALAGNADCLRVLLEKVAPRGDVWDRNRQLTPLHCAAAHGHLSCLRLLLDSGMNINAGLNTNQPSPLHYAVQSNAIDCVKELLINDAIPNTPQVYSETPLHIAVRSGFTECIKLLLAYGAAVNVKYGANERSTPLHLAADDPDSTALLLTAGGHVNAINARRQTPLHLAALAQCTATVDLLLKNGANPNMADNDGRTPLHAAIVKVSRSYECVRELLAAGANPNAPDRFGYTPLHLAALNEFSVCVMLLVEHGGDVTMRTNGGVSVLTFITRKTPDVIPKLINKFDNSIKLNDHELGDVDCEVKLDFRVLVPSVGQRETELLLSFIEVGRNEILEHPLCETFLFLKWRRIRKFFIFSLLHHALFVLLFSLYVSGVYLKDCPAKRRIAHNCVIPIYAVIFGYILIGLNLMALCKEVFQIAHSWLSYIKHWDNWLQWLRVICVFGCIQPYSTFATNIQTNIFQWQHYVAALAIFFAWVEMMMIIGRFPTFGLYIQMFTTVSWNFAKFVAAYFCLLIAFTFSFGVIFADYKSFINFFWILLKVIIMMSGELEFEDIFFNEHDQLKYNWTAYVMFLAFVLLVTIILTNLMVGLAVSDIQGLQKSAGLDRIVRQVELVAHLESMLFSRLLAWLPAKVLHFFHRQASLLRSRYHWAIYIRPNDPREARVPKELIKSIYQLVAERKDKLRKKSVRKLPRFHRHSDDRQLRMQMERLWNEFDEMCANFREKLHSLEEFVKK